MQLKYIVRHCIDKAHGPCCLDSSVVHVILSHYCSTIGGNFCGGGQPRTLDLVASSQLYPENLTVRWGLRPSVPKAYICTSVGDAHATKTKTHDSTCSELLNVPPFKIITAQISVFQSQLLLHTKALTCVYLSAMISEFSLSTLVYLGGRK